MKIAIVVDFIPVSVKAVLVVAVGHSRVAGTCVVLRIVEIHVYVVSESVAGVRENCLDGNVRISPSRCVRVPNPSLTSATGIKTFKCVTSDIVIRPDVLVVVLMVVVGIPGLGTRAASGRSCDYVSGDRFAPRQECRK